MHGLTLIGFLLFVIPSCERTFPHFTQIGLAHVGCQEFGFGQTGTIFPFGYPTGTRSFSHERLLVVRIRRRRRRGGLFQSGVQRGRRRRGGGGGQGGYSQSWWSKGSGSAQTGQKSQLHHVVRSFVRSFVRLWDLCAICYTTSATGFCRNDEFERRGERMPKNEREET